MDLEPAYSRYPLATVNQRLGALIVDFLSCWFISELTVSILSIDSANPLHLFIFISTWFVFRVFIAARAQGQSFGRWLISIRVIDAEYGKTAGLGAFMKREIFVFICSIFLIKTITSTLIVFAWIPFVADAAFAIVDNEKRQAFHDRISGTISIQTRKGFAIDEKLGKLFNKAGQQATQLYQSRQERSAYEDEYSASAPRPKPKRRPRTKSRPPQDFNFERDSNFDRSYQDSYQAPYTDPYAEPLDPPRNVYKGDVDGFDDWDKDNSPDGFGDRSKSYGNTYEKPYEDEPPIKRSARRPRRR
ncbi:RDD family protein [Pseudanabaena sp. UWO310]|uniref:RDD family protein n=1 Tax=Pseudanabaena sp. UWO310 TaxID=2480795 RepID=UPI0011576438|nr:RDD family protein [Pseudanabaena sp. UWO310]TYQ28544.1 RDD family protein [Pseudanabaena sp. UWO310]